jgi:hypothetical protein
MKENQLKMRKLITAGIGNKSIKKEINPRVQLIFKFSNWFIFKLCQSVNVIE